MPDAPATLPAARGGGASRRGGAAGSVSEQCGVLCAPYDLTAELAAESAGPDRAALVVAAVAVTMCRWTAASEVAIAVTGRSSWRVDAAWTARLPVNDHLLIDDFLRAVHMARGAGGNDGLTADGEHLDIVVASDLADLAFGEIRFLTEGADAAPGFVADLATAVEELLHLDGVLGDVRCIAPERRRILDALAGAEVPEVDIETLFLGQVRRSPQQVAVRDPGAELTYEQLAYAAERYADTLWRAGVRPGDTVLVATRRSVGEVVALLAIIRLGAAYAGIDEDAPEARAERIIGKLTPAAAVVDAATTDHPTLRELTRVDAWRPGQEAQPGTGPLIRPPRSSDPRRAAYIAFTSGSTGEPKGVVVPHRAVTRLALSAELRMQPGDRVLRMAPLAFDASTLEVWVTLLTGATLEVFPAKLPSIGKLEAFFAERRISIAWLPAGLFRLIAQSRPKVLAGVRWILSGGEVVPHEYVARMLELHPGLVITNGYGPTENTTFTTTYTVRDSTEIDGPLPIGRPVAGTRVFVLDRNGRLVPPGAVGELYAAGSGLADGYLDDAAETSSRFGYFSLEVNERLYRTGDLVRLDPRGNVMFLGRVDKQIKLNGHRIETEEISATLARHPDVRDAVVIVAQQATRDTQLIAAVAVRSGADTGPRLLRAYLAQLLPSYAIPTLWVMVDEIPLTRNGKVDVQILTESATPAVRAERSL